MKIIFRIIVILFFAGLIAGGFYLIVNKGGLAASGSTGGDFRPGLSASNSGQPPAGFDGGGDRGGGNGSLGEGLAGVLGTLAKLAGIAALVIFLQKGIALLLDKRNGARKTV